MFSKFDFTCMQVALLEAQKAYQKGEVPIGAVIADGTKILSRAHNLVESTKSSTAHAEILAIQEASNQVKDWRLENLTLYVTIEPCVMCAGAAILSRLDTIIFAAPSPRHGAAGSWTNLFTEEHPIHQIKIQSGLMETEAKDLMQRFFKERRKQCANSNLYSMN